MPRLATIGHRLRALFRARSVESELDEELRFHLEREIEINVAKGMSREEARLAALRSFGGIEQVKEQCRDERGVRLIKDLGRDALYGIRTLRKNPGFTAAAVLTLMLGIGATTAMFSVVSGALLQPLPYEDSEQLMLLWTHTAMRGDDRDWISRGLYATVREQNRVFEDAAIVDGHSTVLRGKGTPERIRGISASASCLSMLGARPVLGRLFEPGEDEVGRPGALILSHGLWKRKFGAEPGVIGRTIELDDGSYTIVGVLEAGFGLTREYLPMVVRADYWVLIPLGPEEVQDHLHRWYGMIARLKADVSPGQAQAEMSRLAALLSQERPDTYAAEHDFSIEVIPFLKYVAADAALTLWMLFGAIGLVLLIACANVAGLLLARATGRRQEFGIRLALGAGRGRLMRQLLAESLLLSLLGGTLGVLIAWWSLPPLLALGGSAIPRSDEIGINPAIIIFGLGVSLLTCVIFGLFPAFTASRAGASTILRKGQREVCGLGLGRPFRGSFRHGLVVGQIALSFTLLIGAGLLLHSFQRLQRVDPGFSPYDLLTFQLAAVGEKYETSTSVIQFYEELEHRIAGVPGVEAVGGVSILPFGPNTSSGPIEAEDQPDTYEPPVIAEMRAVTWDYFDTMCIPLLRGRRFDERDTRHAPAVAIVDEQFAGRFWPDESAIGKRFRLADFPDVRLTIVGVVGSIKHYRLEAEPRITMYQPHAQSPWQYMYVAAKTALPPAAMTDSIARAVWSVDPNLPLLRVASMEERVADSLASRRFQLTVLTGFAGLALVLAVVGLYGLLTYVVGRGTRDIGIRMAFGARRAKVLFEVLYLGGVLALIGLAVGFVLSVAGVGLLTGLLYDLSPLDPLTFICVSLVVLGVTLVACCIPAYRATKVDPAVALRHE